MNNQTVQENQWIGSLLVNDKGQNGDRDQAATIFLFVVYLSFLLTAIIFAIFANRRCRTREREQQKPIMVKMLTLDRLPSYKTIFFDEDPSKYHELNLI